MGDLAPEVLEPAPKGMTVDVTHSGVRWGTITSPAAIWVAMIAIVASAVALGLLGHGAYGTGWWGGLPLVLAVPIALQVSRTTLSVTDRAVTVHVRRALSSRVDRFPLDEITQVSVAHPQGDAVLVVRSEEHSVGVGRGQPEAHLSWMVEAIDLACQGFAARERAEGREWSFLRKAPEELQALRGDPAAQTEGPPSNT